MCPCSLCSSNVHCVYMAYIKLWRALVHMCTVNMLDRKCTTMLSLRCWHLKVVSKHPSLKAPGCQSWVKNTWNALKLGGTGIRLSWHTVCLLSIEVIFANITFGFICTVSYFDWKELQSFAPSSSDRSIIWVLILRCDLSYLELWVGFCVC